jgi:hypothetical protein
VIVLQTVILTVALIVLLAACVAFVAMLCYLFEIPRKGHDQ